MTAFRTVLLLTMLLHAFLFGWFLLKFRVRGLTRRSGLVLGGLAVASNVLILLVWMFMPR